MLHSPKEWFPPCYTTESLLPALKVALGVTTALAEVARWLPDGGSNATIGAKLNKSEHTVRSQARQLSSALNVKSREALVARIVARLWAYACFTGAWPPPGSG
ncbi:MAG: LuxR C-terminal-related transcriptional regulator [Gemmatimonadales bacterium]|nr:LuxR C-terminal-related transcriptional regulator [Gemmatimonadales bacterium]MDZ4389677.1 LuxR C-terminal-related transcriptional regulator [Gemmatimonadales bacterium]